MTQNPPGRPAAVDLPAVVEKRSRFSIVWLIPILAAVLGAWLFYKHLTEAGIPIQLTFETAAGLEAGKTKILFRSVAIGLVDSIEVTEDSQHVRLHATIDRKAESYLRKTTRFWVVRPRITTSGISGLGTLLSGAHITLEPGSGKPAHVFTGLESPPPLAADTPGCRFKLRSKSIGSIGDGSPILYRGIKVGEVLSHAFDDEQGDIKAEFFIQAPYHKFVREKTQFWNASGLEVEVGAEGMNVHMESVEALLIGGIAFRTPKLGQDSPPAKIGHEFTLHPSEKLINHQFNVKRHYVMYFDGSVRGLNIGAPVEMSGLQLGEVVSIDVEMAEDGLTMLIPVTLQIEPERLGGRPVTTDEEAMANARALIQRGIRGQLKTGSLLTGQLFVDLVRRPDTEVKLVNGKSPHLEIPTIPSDFAAIQISITNIVKKLDRLPIEKLVEHATDTIDSFGELARSPELKATLTTANSTLQELKVLLEKVDAQVDPLAKDADATMASLRKTLDEATRTLSEATKALGVVEGAVGKQSAARVELVNMLREAAAAARAFRQLTNYLERHPEALLKGKPGSGGK